MPENLVTEEICLKEGAAVFLRKPIDPHTLYPASQWATKAMHHGYICLIICLNVIIESGQIVETDARNGCFKAFLEHDMYVSTPRSR